MQFYEAGGKLTIAHMGHHQIARSILKVKSKTYFKLKSNRMRPVLVRSKAINNLK